MARKTLDQWIAEAVNDSNMDGKCTMLSCVHQQGQNQKEVYSVKIGDTAINQQELAAIFHGKAENAIGEAAGNQRFFLLAFYGNRSESQQKYAFSISGTVDTDAGATEAPTKEGLTQQGMRHMETGYMFWARQVADVIKMQSDMMKNLAEQNVSLMHENRDAVSVVKDLIFATAVQQNEHAMKQLAFKRDSEMRSKFLELGPSLVNSMMGVEVFPQPVADTALVETVIEAITKEPNAIEKLAGVLPPTIMGPLAARAADHLKRKKEAEETAMRVLGGENANDAK